MRHISDQDNLKVLLYGIYFRQMGM